MFYIIIRGWRESVSQIALYSFVADKSASIVVGAVDLCSLLQAKALKWSHLNYLQNTQVKHAAFCPPFPQFSALKSAIVMLRKRHSHGWAKTLISLLQNMLESYI